VGYEFGYRGSITVEVGAFFMSTYKNRFWSPFSPLSNKHLGSFLAIEEPEYVGDNPLNHTAGIKNTILILLSAWCLSTWTIWISSPFYDYHKYILITLVSPTVLDDSNAVTVNSNFVWSLNVCPLLSVFFSFSVRGFAMD
jgi:hypothetical protein